MAIIPTIRCREIRRSVYFYTHVLDFTRADDLADDDDFGFAVLSRAGDRIFLSTGRGDGEFDQRANRPDLGNAGVLR